jgi:hypothetical protein
LLYFHSPYDVSPANYQYASTYDNFLFAIAGTDGLEAYLRESGKNFRQLKTYLTLRKTNFCATPKERVVYIGNLWDPRRKNELGKLFQLLDETDYCDFYGATCAWRRKHLRSWRGEIYLQGLRDVQDIMESAGIALLLHHRQQYETGSAVYRDFEALSSSCIIITEKTAFMVEKFEDCVLFIDTDRPVEEIFEQINAHVKWIHAHPEEAIEMARRSHQRFCDKFSLEVECKKILKFVDEISSDFPARQCDNLVANKELSESL